VPPNTAAGASWNCGPAVSALHAAHRAVAEINPISKVRDASDAAQSCEHGQYQIARFHRDQSRCSVTCRSRLRQPRLWYHQEAAAGARDQSRVSAARVGGRFIEICRGFVGEQKQRLGSRAPSIATPLLAPDNCSG